MSDFGHEIGVQRETYTEFQNGLEKILLNCSALERSEFDRRIRLTVSATQEQNRLVHQHNKLLDLEKKQAKKWDNSYLIFIAACFVLVPILYFYDPTPFQKAAVCLVIGANFGYWGLARKIENSTNWVVERNLSFEISRLEREKNQFGVLTCLSEACRSDLSEGTSDDVLKEWLIFSRDKALLDLKFDILKTMHIPC